MPFADELLSFTRSRGVRELRNVFSRAFSSTERVLEDIGPSAGRMAYEIRGVDDDAAMNTAQYGLNLDKWANIDEGKRKASARLARGWAYPDDAPRFADPEVQQLASEMRPLFAKMNERILATTDAMGNPMQSRDPYTGEWRDYRGITENYFPNYMKRQKRESILDPIEYTQSEMERRLSADFRAKNDIGRAGLLGREQELQIRDDVSNAIDEYLRTGSANSIIKDPEILSTMQPAYDTFTELATHMRRLAVNEANKTGAAIPEEVDPILALFGSKDPESTQKGIKLLKGYLLRDAENARRNGSLESSRSLPLPRDWYEDDPLKVVPAYLFRGERRLAEVKRFGQNNELVLDPDPEKGILAGIKDERDKAYVKKVFDRAMGLEPYNKSLKAQNWLDTIFATQVLKLGTAQVSQLGQVMNSIMETDLSSTWRGIANLKMSKDVAVRSGATFSRLVDIAREGLNDPSEVSGAKKFTESFLKYSGFSYADLLARHIGAGAGFVHGEEMLFRLLKNEKDPHALRELRRLIPGADKNEVVWREFVNRIDKVRAATGGRVAPADIEKHFTQDLDNIARTVSMNANFRNSILDLPLWASSPTGKMISMFRTFAYRQTKFMKNRVIDDWKAGNPRPLIALAAGAGVLGPLISLFKSIPRGGYGQEMQENQKAFSGDNKTLALKAAENLATVGAFGVFDQVARAMRKGPTGWFEFLAGPLFTDMANAFGGVGHLVGGATGIAKPEAVGQGVSELAKFAGGHVPVIGGGINNALRAITERVERSKSGLVTREKSHQLLGKEPEPIEIGDVTLPALPILLGLESSAKQKRGDLLDQIKGAIESGNQVDLMKLIKLARDSGVNITPASINRLMKEHLLSQAEQ